MGYKKGARVKTFSVFKTQAIPSVSTSNSLRNIPQLLPSGLCTVQHNSKQQFPPVPKMLGQYSPDILRNIDMEDILQISSEILEKKENN